MPIDRTRPLWEAWVIEGLKDNLVGFVCKIHHAAIDGASSAEIMTALYDLQPEPTVFENTEVTAEGIPSTAELLGYAAMSKLKRAGNAVPLVARTVRSALAAHRRHQRQGEEPRRRSSHRTPDSVQPVNRPTEDSCVRVPLDEIKAIKTALDVKVNDVVLALCSGTLRRYLELHDALPGPRHCLRSARCPCVTSPRWERTATRSQPCSPNWQPT